MTITEAIQSIVNRNDDTILKDSNKFKAYLKDLCSDNPKELKIISRALDDKILNIIFCSEEENIKIARLRSEFEDQGMSDNWIDFILQSFSQVLNWNYVKKESSPEEITVYTEMTLSGNTCCYIKDKYIEDSTTDNSNIYNKNKPPYKLFENRISFSYDELYKNFNSNTLLDIPKTCKYKGRNYKIVAIDDFAYGINNCKKINIPDSITYIGNVFENCQAIEEINFPNTTIECDNLSFTNCVNLKKIVLPKGLQKICSYCFKNCLSLKSITIPNSVTTIDNEAFLNCINLKTINIPNNITTIGQRAFGNCSTLRNIIINEGTTTIGERAFENCFSLENITIPKSVIEIGPYLFNYCYSLKEINISKNCKIHQYNYQKNKDEFIPVNNSNFANFIGKDVFNCQVNIY